MESPVMVLFILAAIAGLVALEMRQAKAIVASLGAALLLAAVAMFVMGAVEVGVGIVVAGAALVLVLLWAFRKTGQSDALPALPGGAGGVLAVICVVVFAAVLFVVARPFFDAAPAAGAASHSGGYAGLLREVLVIVAALAAVWAMLRKAGRRDE